MRTPILHLLERLFHSQHGVEETRHLDDSELLTRFVRQQDESAFAAILARHGRLVWGVCRSVLANDADAEDAFQATFVALFRCGGSIRQPRSLAPWLHGTASRIARKVQQSAIRRNQRERRAARPEAAPIPESDENLQTIYLAVHDAVARLPEPLREAFVLCALQGCRQVDAAAQLGIPLGTLSARVSRARKTVLERLASQGIPGTGAVTVLVSLETSLLAAVPGPLLNLVRHHFAHGFVAVSNSVLGPVTSEVGGPLMLWKRTLAVVFTGVLVVGGLGFLLPYGDQQQGQTREMASRRPARLDGRWRCVETYTEGKRVLPELACTPLILTFQNDVMSSEFDFLGGDCSFTLPPGPAGAIDLRFKSGPEESIVVQGLYSLDGDSLSLCLPMEDARLPRPTRFGTEPKDGLTTFLFAREKPGEERPNSLEEELGTILWMSRHREAGTVEQQVARCRKLVADYPRSQQAVVALLCILANAPESPAAQEALTRLENGGLAHADLDTLAFCTGISRGTLGRREMPSDVSRRLAPHLLDCVRRSPGHPAVPALLSSVCNATKEGNEANASPIFDEAARRLGDRWVTSPDLTHFLESLNNSRQRPWALQYETIVRKILAESPSGYIRCRAAFTLAAMVAEGGEARQEEARQIYVHLVNTYQREAVAPDWRDLADSLVEQARREVDSLLVRGIGGPAPAFQGVDLDGRPMALSDFRGKVVLLSFWASWCRPCMHLISHEREVVERFKDRPFVLVGVNGDAVEKFDRTLIQKHRITWRSFQNERPGQPTLSEKWNLHGWPELYLIDHNGVIRRRWCGAPPASEMDEEISRWIAVAEGKPLVPLAQPKSPTASEPIQGKPVRFIEKVLGGEKGGAVRYQVCLPKTWDGRTPLPVVLFLHGSGQVGTDNRGQLEIGLGPALRKQGLPFSFLGVFPQARAASWQATSPDGQQVMAILKAVEQEHPTDPRRVYLTGVSMGGEGVWSLAAAHPGRFAAIIPVCGGGDPREARALRDVPCWAFHGDADTVVPPHSTREMMRAIAATGGRPQYQEYCGVGHNCWDRVYANAELYRWLEGQALK